MLTCETCGKNDIKTGQGLAGHMQFAHKQLSSGLPAAPGSKLATEAVVYEGLNELEKSLQEELEQLEQVALQLGSKAEISDLKQRVEILQVAMSGLVDFVESLSAVVLHIDGRQRGDEMRAPLFASFTGDNDAVEWWKEEVYKGSRDIVVKELRARS